MNKVIFLTLICFSILSCKSEPNSSSDSKDLVLNNIYTNEEIGWEITIPEGWEVKQMNSEQISNGSKVLSENTGNDYTEAVKNLDNLIGFEKNHSSFYSSLEPFVEDYKGEFLISLQNLKEDLMLTYQSIGLNVESTENSIEEIDGKEFHTYKLFVYQEGKLILTQVNYDTLFGDKLFGVIISYRDPEAKKELMNAWKNSTFKN